MKIAILTPTFFEFSGIDRLVEEEAERLAKNKNSVTVFTFAATLKTKHAKVVVLGMPKNSTFERIYRLFFFLDFLKVGKCVNMLREFDVVVSHFYPMNIIASSAKKRFNLRYVYHNAGVAFPKLFGNFFERAYLRLFVLFNRLSIRNADEAISNSGFLMDELKKETGMDSTVEYPAIDGKRFNKKVNGTGIRKRYGLGNAPVVLYVGRISPHKGVHILVGAFKAAKKEIPELKLVVAGKPTFERYFRNLKESVKEFGKDVIFTGFVKDEELPEFYAACDVYASASLWEGYNLPLAEAQACGKPVVAFDLCSHSEVVKNGVLVKEGDVEGFAEGIVRLARKFKTDKLKS